ncbi:glycoside hydrolase family 3 C-terminal domain-containing protein [Niabella sp. CC-SYL272]|uniref:glycoside hydrolase family 3 C-terminal domain-containing protein n=1 Tax=Niabella agricola TaxID=2891571 RepID=UPI001F173A57|nr:glycoside hydrolase family 3 C-terminal domain-containing protein [Niabella agricola]MCF3108195.1 glycoside hydrolase family 3 C-terminal domain-containing protein [Niabella agricola]
MPLKKIASALIAVLSLATAQAQDYKQYPMWNAALPMEQRVSDLVDRLTLEEKVAQMLNAAPAVPRLGIPAYEWWNEILHGVARTAYKTTVYPQAIGMAATWDTAALKQMAFYSALEGRAIHNLAVKEGKTGERYKGLTYWTPNINIFRDPRWGRGQETYGEDPFLTGKLGAAFVRGLQGNDPKYLLAAACAKHYAVHSGPEESRHTDNFNPTPYDLWDTYLPAFKELVVNARVAGVMCAYNAVYKQPCCGSDLLMSDILRNQWHFTGYVTSDCGGIDDFVKRHKTHKTNADASADAVMHGTDVECGNSVYRSLVDAVKTGLIAEKQIDNSIRRLFTIRYRLGMFDPADKVPYGQLPMRTLEAPEHKALSLKMARESIVLLKNTGILPLSKKLKQVAVIGPNADNRIALLGNYNGFPSRIVSILEGIKEKLGPEVLVTYQPGISYTTDTLFAPDTNDANFYSYKEQPGFYIQYFNNEALEGTPVYTTQLASINRFFPQGQPPAPGVASDHYSARYKTSFRATADSVLQFQMEGDDGYRLFINDSLVVNAWNGNLGVRNLKWKVQKDQTYNIMLEYRQHEDGAFIRLQKGTYKKANMQSIAASVASADAIIYAGGISPELEGEQMWVNAKGFSGGDRTSIMLPEVQTELLKQLKATGKPVVFVMLTGSAIAIPWEQKELPAVLNAWYGGQSAGTAIADVLFGDYNPSGRLPVTFYKDDASLPDFKQYDMTGRTYRYYNKEVLYPFGWGLSYTRFKYSRLTIPAGIAKGKQVPVSVWVTNTGSRDGDEVVQLYLSYAGIKGKAPLRALKGFQRISLKKGATAEVKFLVKPEDLELISETGNRYTPSGRLTISVGGGQPVPSLAGTSDFVQQTITVP